MIVTTLLLYVGSNKENIEHFSKISNNSLLIVDGFTQVEQKIEACCSDNKIDGTVLLYEQITLERDLLAISYLRKKYPYIYIVLVCREFDPKDSKLYLKAGINDTAPSNVDKETLERAIAFIKSNHKKLLSPQSTQTPFVIFKLPLWKRLFDIAFSMAAILILLPILLITYLAVRIESRGPAIYKSKRVGSNYRVFDFWKFRSMYTDADKHLKNYSSQNQYLTPSHIVADATPLLNDAGDLMLLRDTPEEGLLISDDSIVSEHQYVKNKSEEQGNAFVKLENDPRITTVGRFIRKYSIDELPQLINILKGDMSVVGNRPLPLYEAEMLTSDEYIDRFMAPSGLTGLWQVEKRGGVGRMSAEDRKQLDIEYAKHFSFWYDMKLILRTFTAFIQKENV